MLIAVFTWESYDITSSSATFVLSPIALFHSASAHPHRFGSVAPDGQYHSPIQNKSTRFNAMLATLTPSRLAVTFQAMGAMKVVGSDFN